MTVYIYDLPRNISHDRFGKSVIRYKTSAKSSELTAKVKLSFSPKLWKRLMGQIKK